MKEKRLFLNRLVAYKDKTFGLLSYDETPMLTLERKWTEDKNIVGYRANFTCIPTGTHKIKLEMQTDMTYRMRIRRFGYQRNAIFGSEKNMLRLRGTHDAAILPEHFIRDGQYDAVEGFDGNPDGNFVPERTGMFIAAGEGLLEAYEAQKNA